MPYFLRYWGMHSSHSELTEYLKNFSVLIADEVQQIIDKSDVQSFRQGVTLLQEGQVAQQCYLVLRGCVREFVIKDGEEKSTAFYTEGQVVNSFTSLVTQAPARHNLVCAEDCLLTVSDQALEEELCRLVPRLESVIRREVEKSVGYAQDELARFITSSPEDRYLHLLAHRPDLLNRIPQHQIASYIGITPESLSRLRKRIMKKATS